MVVVVGEGGWCALYESARSEARKCLECELESDEGGDRVAKPKPLSRRAKLRWRRWW